MKTMNFFRLLRDWASVILMLQWAWHLGVYGYEKFGVFGLALGVVLSAPLAPTSLFTARYVMFGPQRIWFYSLWAVVAICAAMVWFMKSWPDDESGQGMG
jgi:hypothetical protein